VTVVVFSVVWAVVVCRILSAFAALRSSRIADRFPLLKARAAITFGSCCLGASTAFAVVQPGIDVSHYQGTINWTSVKNAGYQFAFMKATEDTTYVDPTFATNRANATAAGIPIGFYHFCDVGTTATDAIPDANHFLATIKPLYQAGQYFPPVADVESFPTGLSTAQLQTATSAWVQQFSNTIYNSLGVRPIIYTSLSKANSYYTSSVASAHMLWVAQWKGTGTTSPPTASNTPLWGKYDFWQWSDNQDAIAQSMPVPGISGNVDRDVYDGTVAQLLALRLGKDNSKPGDFNRDGKVDAADYNYWKSNNGNIVPLYTGADANGDARVDAKDLSIWAAAVPEPASAGLAVFALTAIGFVSRSRQQK